jgi:DNA repair exonuclease SbcCD ATPase subunit
MSLTRKALVAMGIEAEKIDQIMELHLNTVNEIKSERDELKSDAEKYKDTAKKLEDTEKELSELKAKADQPDAYKEKYDKLKAEYDSYKNDIVSKETKAKKSKAYRDMLKEIGVSEKRLDSVMKVADYNSIEFEEDGTIKGVEELKKQVQEEWSDFIVSEGTQGAPTPTPPVNNGGTMNEPSNAAKRAIQYRNNLYGTPNKEE